ncbi:hypothetical protein FFLO_06727 [Filobasidium floriforme]|uniref:Uncharacterized protein n=1 Tax=Filobasidium floriforme TaxID=5210 RepID=A0A8K0NQ69_9TREE|nr:uncharacterized protein HD553DRAFT_341337 [Filobasidium floriforme]KAG7527647.1 hypothetical protein FFLO_06727 [Filobasidium floriforme]KAH8086506.1 hypothetical protein HD553DRAFT_341337 [Filobasidium floriforme]
MSSDKTSASAKSAGSSKPSGSSSSPSSSSDKIGLSGSSPTSSSASATTTPVTPNPKINDKGKKRKISVEATSSNETLDVDDSPGFKKIKPLQISTEPCKEEYKWTVPMTQLARNREKEQRKKRQEGKEK